MKRFFSVAFTMILLLSLISSAFTVSAAHAPVRVVGYKMEYFDGDKKFYLKFLLDTDIGNARHLQTQAKKPEAEVPKDAWDFDALVTDGGRNCVLVNGISIGDYLDALGGQWAPSLHFEKDRKTGQQYLTTVLNDIPDFANASYKKKNFALEVTDGFLSREHWKFEPFVAKWNAKTQKLVIYRDGDNGQTLEEALSGKPTAKPTAPPTAKPTNKPNAETTAKPIGSGATTPATSDTGSATDVSGEETTLATVPTGDSLNPEEVIPALGSFDITSKSKDIVIDFPNKVVTLGKAMTVKDFLSQMEGVSGYKLGVYNGSKPVDEKQMVVEGYKFKVYVDDKLIGNFLLKAPKGSGSNTVILIVCIVGGIVLLAGAAVLVYVFVIRKKLKK